MINNQIGKRYAEALYSLLIDKKKQDLFNKMNNALEFFASILKDSSDFKNIMLHPYISRDIKREVITSLLTKRSEYNVTFLKNFLFLLIEKNRQKFIIEIHKEFKELIYKKLGKLQMEVTVAKELSSKHKTELKKTLEKQLNKEIDIDYSINPSIIGGIMFKIKDRVFDGSIKGMLSKFSAQFIYH